MTKRRLVLSHVVDAYERGGRFGEDILSVQCRYCKRIWKDEEEFSRNRIGDKPCPARHPNATLATRRAE